MKKVFQRLIIFFTGVPVLLSLIVFLPQYNHLCLNLVAIAFSVFGAVEFRNILSHKKLLISVPETVILGAISPVAWTLMVCFGVVNIVNGVFIVGASWLLVSGIFTSQDKFDSYIGRIAAGFAVMIYPGLFMAWIVRMSALREASMVILVYFLVVFLNDAMAWVVGNLFGKGNQGLVPASPKKSIAGFIGGLVASVVTGIAAAYLLPGSFTPALMSPVLAGALLGFGAGIAGTVGDLGESAIKRSAVVKDSGALILGRGGALDCIDSLSLAAPVYYMLYRILFLS